MSEQGRRPDDQSEQFDLADEDYQKAEEKLLLALAKLRLLNDPEHPSSLREVISRARWLAETYKQWGQSGSPIQGIYMRLSNGEKLILDQIDNTFQCRIRLKDGLPSRPELEIWKEADEHFDEVLLGCLSLSETSPEGVRFKKSYPNGQTLSLQVKFPTGEDISISGEFTVLEASASRTRVVSAFWKMLRNVQRPLLAHPAAYLAAAVVMLMTIGTLQLKFFWRDDRRMQVEKEIALLQTPQAPRGIGTQTVIIMPYAALRSVERRVVSDVEELDVSTPSIRLLLQLPPGEIAESYEATLTDALDRTSFTVRQLRRDNNYVSLVLSRQFIPTGSYRLALSHDDEAPIYYEFRVVKRSRAQPPDQD
jgi:hypothetical protein